MNHDFDLVTEFCRACGAGALEVAEGKRPRDCEGGGNMVAISHVVRGRRLRQAFDRSCAITIYRPGDPGYIPPPGWTGYDFTKFIDDDGPGVA